jgi:glyoxylase-like metal-dependent hydrolase (beta-lactamase superfamily II)
MKIHAIKTGDVLVKSAFLGSPATAGPLPYMGNIFLDRTRVRIPILAWVIEHPEGVIVVDTGEDPANKGNFITQSRYDVAPEEAIGEQLKKLGVGKKDVSKVVLTHLHGDHKDGVKDFLNTPIWVSEREYNLSPSANSKFFTGLGLQTPTLFNFNAEQVGSFQSSISLTNDGSVLAVPTPGHTAGHVSVIVMDSDVHYFIAGDVTYKERTLISQTLEGPSTEVESHRQTLRRVLDYVRQHPTVYLPSHDPASAQRLAIKQTTATTALQVDAVQV